MVAECIGKLVLVNPHFLLPRFRKQLAAGRGLGIKARQPKLKVGIAPLEVHTG